MSRPALFPIFLKLEGRRVLVVGGGRVAAAKLPALISAGAEVRVVATDVVPSVARFVDEAGVTLERRAFRPSDLDGAWLVVAAAPPAVNAEVARAAEWRRVFVNAVDDPQRGSAYTGGVLRRGGVTIAVSTEGRAPALAGLLREGLEAALPEEVESWVGLAADLRSRQRAAGVPFGERRPRLLEALNELYASREAEVVS